MSLVLRGNKQTNKQKTFPWREGGKEGGEAGKEGRERGGGEKESFVWAECFELRYVYVSLTTVFESNYKPCKGW